MREKRKIVYCAVMLLSLFICAAYAAGPDLPAAITILEGERHTLIEDFGTDVVFSCTDPSIVFIDEHGVITGRTTGTAMVTAQQGDWQDQCMVTVREKGVLQINAPSSTVYASHPVMLAARMSTSEENIPAAWKSSNVSVAKVSDTGRLVPIRPGTVTITAKLEDGTTASRTFTVKNPSVKLSAASITLYAGTEKTLDYTVYPADCKFDLTWSSSAWTIASVKNGVITGKNPGTATVTAKLSNGTSVRCTVTVKAPTIRLNKTGAAVYEGKTTRLTASAQPASLAEDVIFYSSNKNVATVDRSGLVTGVAPGTATITAKLPNGAKASCTVTVKKSSLSLNKGKTSVYEGKTTQLTANITPADGLYDAAAFSSSNRKVATVDETGLVTGVAPGTATITAKLPNGAKASCTVTVKRSTVALNKSKISLYEGKTAALTATITPEGGLYDTVTFHSSNKKVATVDAGGVITGIAPGTATITAKLPNGEKTTCTVTVKKSTVSLNVKTLSLYESFASQLIASIAPADGLYDAVTFTTSNGSVAEVDADGMVTGIAPGTATITAKLPNGSKASCTVTVKKSTVALNKSKTSLYEGKTTTLTATITPEGGLYDTVVFYSSNKKVATVDADGVVTGVFPGTANITVKLPNGEKAVCTVTVKRSTVSLNKSKISLYEGKTTTLTATITPEGGLYDTVAFYSSNKKVATVDASGVVTGVSPGTATITAKLPNGQKTACTVTVKKSTISFSSTGFSIYHGQDKALKTIIQPADGKYTSAVFTSSNKKVVSVSADGIITGKGVGTATITAKLPNGSSASCTVTVKKSVVYFDAKKCAVYLGAETPLTLVVPKGSGLENGVVYTSTDPDVVQVDQQGNVRGLRQGSAVIKARIKNGATVTIPLTVQLPGVKVSSDSLVLYMDSDATLRAAEYPSTGANIPFEVTNSDPSVAEITSSGKVIPRSVGKTTITFTHPNGNSDACVVEVRDYEVYSVKVSPAESMVYQGETLDLRAEVLHARAEDKSIVWSSSDRKVASVDQNGRVTAVGKGTCTITARAANGVSGSCKITVNGPTYRALLLTQYGIPGMNRYMPPAQTATRTVSAALKAKGYSISAVYTPLQKGEIASRMMSVGAKADQNDVTLIYITTHGVVHGGRFYLTIPGWYEDVGNPAYGISSSELLEMIRGIDGHVVLCLNACHSGTLLQEASGALSGMDVTVICSSQGEYGSGWYNGSDTSRWDFMSWGVTRAFGYDMPTGMPITLFSDKNGDGCVSAGELGNYVRYYTSRQAQAYFGTPGFVGDDAPQVPQIFVTDPDQILSEP